MIKSLQEWSIDQHIQKQSNYHHPKFDSSGERARSSVVGGGSGQPTRPRIESRRGQFPRMSHQGSVP
jgi:hypothetical protein